MKKIQNYINGQLDDPVSGTFIENIDPSIGKPYGLIPDSDHHDVEKAVEAAEQAFEGWSNMPVAKRSEIMLRIADLIDSKNEELALAECIDNGKPLKLAQRVDIPRAAANMRFYATAVLHYSSESHHMDDGSINYTLRPPVGIAGCISPWNLPLYLFTWKIAPALAVGNTVVAKPSEITPMTAFLFSQICIEAGLPAGVLNIVHGLGPKVGAAIVAHPDVPIISFTGGTATGKHISSVAAPMFKKLSLELGGKNPNIIFSDCDFDNAVQTSVHSSFSNQGQICLCGSRILVEEDLYDRFLESFVKKVKEFKVGDPLDENTKVGAMSSKTHMNKVLSYIQLAGEEGGQIITGGRQLQLEGRCTDGYFIEPTVITGLSSDCRVNQEEIFGPVVTVTSFKTKEEAVALANNNKYGLSATLWTENIKKAHSVAGQLKSGIVWVNCWLVRDLRTPFGGMKQSGVGREGGTEALRFFTETKNVCVKL